MKAKLFSPAALAVLVSLAVLLGEGTPWPN
jgi:hypothetical protein